MPLCVDLTKAFESSFLAAGVISFDVRWLDDPNLRAEFAAAFVDLGVYLYGVDILSLCLNSSFSFALICRFFISFWFAIEWPSSSRVGVSGTLNTLFDLVKMSAVDVASTGVSFIIL